MEENCETVFVRNLPYDATSKRLIEIFSDIAPVKKAAIMRSDNISKGFGFVRYLHAEDAESAARRFNGTEFDGRVILVELAHKKSERFRFEKKAAAAKARLPPPAVVDGDEAKPEKRKLETDLSHRFVLILNFDDSSHDSNLTDLVTRLGGSNGLESVFLAFEPNEKDLKANHYSIAVNLMKRFQSIYSSFLKSVDNSKLVLAMYSSSEFARQSVKTMNKRCIDRRVAETVWSLISVDLNQARQWNRLIIRNISFTAATEAVAACFVKFGVWLYLSLPSSDAHSHAGFGFLTFALKSSVTMALEKKDCLICGGRSLQVSKCDIKQPEKKQKKEEEDDEKKDPDYVPSEDDDDDDDDQPRSRPRKSSEVDEPNNQEDDDDDVKEDDEEEVKEPADDVDQGRTIFVRGIPFTSLNKDLLEAFKPFGTINYAVLVPQRENALLNKGCGFVKFENVVDANRAIEMSHHVVIGGRSLIISLAQSKEAWNHENGRAGDRSNNRLVNKRYVYLVHEGTISKLKMKKQEQYLMTNTMNFINPKRLCIRGLAPSVSNVLLSLVSSKLSSCGLHASMVREADVNRFKTCNNDNAATGRGHEVSVDETERLLSNINIDKVWIKKSQIIRNLAKQKIESLPIPKFLQTKRTKNYESEVHEGRGFGFIDFESHVEALAAVRYFMKLNQPADDDNVGSDQDKQLSRLLVQMKSPNTDDMSIEFCMEDYVKATRQVGRDLSTKRRLQEEGGGGGKRMLLKQAGSRLGPRKIDKDNKKKKKKTLNK